MLCVFFRFIVISPEISKPKQGDLGEEIHVCDDGGICSEKAWLIGPSQKADAQDEDRGEHQADQQRGWHKRFCFRGCLTGLLIFASGGRFMVCH